MSNKYPEHIDQVDTFYQTHLAEVEVAPPADMWEKISASCDEEQNKKGFFFYWRNKQKLIGIILISLLIGISSYFYFNLDNTTSPADKESLPLIKDKEVTTSSSFDKTVESQAGNPSKKKNANKNTSNAISPLDKVELNNTKHSKEQKVSVEENSTNTSVEQSNSIIVETPIEQPVLEKTPKKKTSFKDKHKKEYQDSTRNLFVPTK